MLKVVFFGNGMTMAFEDGEQVPEAQESWFVLYVKHLEERGYDPLDAQYQMPDGRMVKAFRLLDGEWSLWPALTPE